MRELYSGITGLMIFWINIILLFEVVNTEVIIRNIVPIIIAGCYGILSYIAILRVDEMVSSLSLCFLLGIGVFLYAFPFKIIIGIYLAVEILLVMLIITFKDNQVINSNDEVINDNLEITNIDQMLDDLYKELDKEDERMKIENIEDPKEEILKLHGEGYKQSEISKRIGKTQGYISRIINQNKNGNDKPNKTQS